MREIDSKGKGPAVSILRRRGAWIVLGVVAVGLLLSPGCEKQRRAEFPEQLGNEDYGRLPGLKGTSLELLQDELARVVEQRGTPELLDVIDTDEIDTDEIDTGGQNSPQSQRIPHESNVADGLADVYAKRTFQSLKDAAEKNYPQGRFEFNALQRRTAVGFFERHRRELRESRAALQRPQCDFGIRHVRGFANDGSFIGHVRLSARLEGLAAAKALFVDDDLQQAIVALKNMLQWAKLLGAEKHVTARLQAGLLRAEALDVLQAIVLHGDCRRQQLEELGELVHGHLSDWPRDADAWIGDRALGMHCYEVVRDGGISSLLTARESEDFSQSGSIEDLSKAAMDVVDQDELFYLGAMRKIIESCRLPYHQRASVAEEIMAEAEAKANSPDYPLVAARLLLPGIGRGLRMQGEDRAAVEAWAAALDAALGRPVSHAVNPLTGKKYQISRQKEQVSVLRTGSVDKQSTGKQDGSLLVVPLH